MEDFDSIFLEYPDLRLQRINDRKSLVGAFPVRLPTGEEVDRFILRIQLPFDEDGIPRVWETGGRIKRNPDEHCMKDGSLCVFLSEERYIFYPRDSKLLSFLCGPLNTYLFGHSYREAHGSWPENFIERRHGVHGKADFYREFLSLPEANGDVLLEIVKQVKNRSYKRCLPCPCGSEKKTKSCHWLVLFELQKTVSKDTLETAFKTFTKHRDVLNRRENVMPGLTRTPFLSPSVSRVNQV